VSSDEKKTQKPPEIAPNLAKLDLPKVVPTVLPNNSPLGQTATDKYNLLDL